MQLRSFFLTALTGMVFFSCDPCRNLDCVADNFHGQFRIVRAATGTDLVFGPTRVYDKNGIRFYALRGTDTTFFDYRPIKFADVGYDSILTVDFRPQTDVAYMRLSDGDIDTLNLSFKTTKTRCCGTITEITNFRFNNRVDIRGSAGTQEIRK